MNSEFRLNKRQLWLFFVGFFILFFHLLMEIYNNGPKILLETSNLEILLLMLITFILFLWDLQFTIDKNGIHSESSFLLFGKRFFLKSKTIKWCNVKKVWSFFPYWFPSVFRGVILKVSFSDSFPINIITNYQEILLYIKKNTNIQMDDNVLKVIEKYIKK